MILLDTNVISEIIKVAPDPIVLAYVNGLPPETAFTAAICEAELRYGLFRLPAGRRRAALMAQIDAFFDIGLQNQVLRFDRACAALYGEVRSAREAAGRPISVQDAMIAATARAYGVAAIATRNVRDFEQCQVSVVDPWLRSRDEQ